MMLIDLRDPPHARTNRVLWQVFDERRRQDEKWGVQNHPDGNTVGMAARLEIPCARRAIARCTEAHKRGAGTWAHILVEEVCEAIDPEETPTLEMLKVELIQVAAVAVAWCEAIERRQQNGES